MQPLRNLVFCPHHPDSALNRINPDPNSSQHAYCPVCLIQQEDGAVLYKKFLTLSTFIDHSAASFAKHKEKITTSEHPEKTYLDAVARKAESLSRLSMHIAEQKDEVNKVYDEIKSAAMDLLEKYRHRDLKMLDQELEKMKGFYESLEETLNATYPAKEELEKMFPSAEDIQKQIGRAKEPARLQKCIKAVKRNLSEIESWKEMGLYDEEKRKKWFEGFIQKLKEEEQKKPQLVFKFGNMKSAKNEVANDINRFFESMFSLQNRLSSQIRIIPLFESKFANQQDLHIIKSWLPDPINPNPKLFYRASEHGSGADKFHQYCDGKGPSLTLINCLFEGAKENTVIGGFLDKSWSSNGEVIKSDKSFLFSISSKVKCPMKNPGYAAYGHRSYGPAFAGGNKFEFVIGKNSNECFLEENYYKGTAKLVNSESWNGKGEIKFKVIDYEVFGFSSDIL